MAQRTRLKLDIANPNAAGIDVGSARHFVAVPLDRDDEAVREFTSFTEDLERLADWLVACGIDTVAMESTGVYWIPLFELLQSRGLTVYLVNARHVKNVSGRKSDVLDCQWLQQLMSYGLLSGAFRPKDEICALRSIMRQRTMLLSYQGQHIQHMQKALSQMNIQLGNVICRRGRRDRPEDLARHHRRRARPTEAGRTQTWADSGEHGANRHGAARQLAGGAFVCANPGSGTVRCVCPGATALRRPPRKHARRAEPNQGPTRTDEASPHQQGQECPEV